MSGLHPRLDRVIAGLESEHQDGGTAIAGAGVERLLRVEHAAVGREEPGLSDRPLSARRGEEVRETDCAMALSLSMSDTIAIAHPEMLAWQR